MQICRFFEPRDNRAHLGCVRQGRVYDLTSYDPERFSSMTAFLTAPDPAGALEAFDKALSARDSYLYDELNRPPQQNLPHLLAPLDRQEVWAAGVTYVRSRLARMEESVGAADHYDRVYEAARPELFFKATPHRTVGPNAPVRIRRDSRWNVPEPELALALSPDLRPVGYTIGNDMSSRDIEGENPLYLPQAKVYLGCCALGPVITLAEAVPDPLSLDIHLAIERNGRLAFEGRTNTSQLKRSLDELIEFLGRDNAFPSGLFLLTGTGIVPGNDFTLEAGDRVAITIEAIGTLSNPVQLGETGG